MWVMCLSLVHVTPSLLVNGPNSVANLANRYERGQVSLCGLFSTTVKDAEMSRFSHVQGEVNSLGKLDHYYGMFGFLASKDEGIWIESPESFLRIKGCLEVVL